MKNLNQFWAFITGANKQGPEAAPSATPYDYSGLYQALYDLYNNNDGLSDSDTTRRLRTVVNRSVEFYASKILPGEVTPIADSPALVEALLQILKDSNFDNNKPAMLRGFALYGDSFVRVRGDGTKVYMEDVSPFYVTDFEDDSRGLLKWIRIDIPTLDDNGNAALYTEYWSAAAQVEQTWLTQLSVTTPISQLGEPDKINSFAELGVSFIPIVHTKFRDNGDQRGIGCVFHALDKIYEANRQATRLHDMFFRFDKPVWAALANAVDPAGRPLPAPRVKVDSGGDAGAVEGEKESVFGDIVYLPGTADLKAMVAPVNYADGLALLNAMMIELEQDMPELRWYSVTNTDQLSGTALRTMLGAAVDRATEAKANFISSLSRMLEMALTIGIFQGEFPATLGKFGTPDFEHTLQVSDPWGETLQEKAASMAAMTSAGIPAPAAMKLAGFTDEQIAEAFPNGQAPAPAKMPTGRTVRGETPPADTKVVSVN